MIKIGGRSGFMRRTIIWALIVLLTSTAANAIGAQNKLKKVQRPLSSSCVYNNDVWSNGAQCYSTCTNSPAAQQCTELKCNNGSWFTYSLPCTYGIDCPGPC